MPSPRKISPQSTKSTLETISEENESKPKNWVPFDCQVNVPALLNDPNNYNPSKRDRFFSKTWGPDFVDPGYVDEPHHIPYPITWRNFDKYLNASRAKIQRHERYQKRQATDQKIKEQRLKRLENEGPSDMQTDVLEKIPKWSNF